MTVYRVWAFESTTSIDSRKWKIRWNSECKKKRKSLHAKKKKKKIRDVFRVLYWNPIVFNHLNWSEVCRDNKIYAFTLLADRKWLTYVYITVCVPRKRESEKTRDIYTSCGWLSAKWNMNRNVRSITSKFYIIVKVERRMEK